MHQQNISSTYIIFDQRTKEPPPGRWLGLCVCGATEYNWTHLVELPQILLLCLVDDSQDSGDGLAHNPARSLEGYKEKVIKLPVSPTGTII